MARPIFEFRDYKGYLTEIVAERGRGEKSRVAAALRCHIAYISQVLNGPAQLSLEQADLLSEYLALSNDEADFLLLLVSHARAGSASLSRRFEARIRQTLQARLSLESRLQKQKVLPSESQAIYYSVWYYAAIHLLITIPEFQTKERIARHLRLPMPKLSQALDFLVATGLAQHAEGRYRAGEVRLYIGNDSPWISRHHANWRTQALGAIEGGEEGSFHYTSVVSMSEEDAPRVRKILVEAIEQVRAVIKASPEKRAYCYLLDFFGV